MQCCWQEDPNERPTFTGICKRLIKMLEAANSQYNYVEAIKNDIEIEFSDSESSEVNV
jgi:hypothetical protein